MKTTRLTFLGLVSLLCWGCSAADPDGGTETRAQLGPRYGREVPLQGVYRSGFEVSVIHLCEKSRQDCADSLRLDDGGCWVEFTEAAVAELERLAPDFPKADEFAEAWVEGTGRIAREPGDFGHLNGYSCQVQLTGVRTIDTGPPYVFRPPLP